MVCDCMKIKKEKRIIGKNRHIWYSLKNIRIIFDVEHMDFIIMREEEKSRHLNIRRCDVPTILKLLKYIQNDEDAMY